MKIIPFPPTKMEDTEWKALDPLKVVSGMPRSSYKILHTNKSREFYAGVYECTAGKWTVKYDEDEFCTLVEGAVVLTSDSGEKHEFSAPASFMIPAGFQGTWEALAYCRKFFAIYERLPQP